MRSRTVRIVLAAFVLIIGGLAVWTFWVPTRDPGGRVIAKAVTPGFLFWSPDARWLEYVAGRARGPGLPVFVAASDGSTTRELAGNGTPAGWLRRPLSALVLEERRRGSSLVQRLVGIDPETGHRRRLPLPFELPSLSWCSPAPSLTRAAGWRTEETSSNLDLVVLGRTRIDKLWSVPLWQVQSPPSWSPDEKTLTVQRHGPRVYRNVSIELIEVTSGARRTLVRPTPYLHGLSWSPDGQEIAFSLIDVDAAGRALNRAENLCETATAAGLRWTRKPGKLFEHLSSRHTRSIIYSVRVRDGRVREVLRLPKGSQVWLLAWSPTGREMAAECYSASGPRNWATIRVFDIPAAKPGDWGPPRMSCPGSTGANDGAGRRRRGASSVKQELGGVMKCVGSLS